MQMIWTCEHVTPLGVLWLEMEGEALRRVRMEVEGPVLDDGLERVEAPERFEAVLAWLDGYFAGDQGRFELPVALAGTAFELEVWGALREIGWGQTTTYGALAKALGKGTAASRAVGAAVGKNPLPIVIPCHRVLGANGAMTGYLGGLEAKIALLRLERVLL
jgi:methylated-DNA-[protein]-cysteine S-methyltransferase